MNKTAFYSDETVRLAQAAGLLKNQTEQPTAGGLGAILEQYGSVLTPVQRNLVKTLQSQMANAQIILGDITQDVEKRALASRELDISHQD
jgi:hypothetical protein